MIWYPTDDYKTYIRCYRDDEVYYTSNQSKFANEFGLYRQSIYDCLRGKQRTHKKWRFEKVDTLPNDLIKCKEDIYKLKN